jgi:hypothetical protein
MRVGNKIQQIIPVSQQYMTFNGKGGFTPTQSISFSDIKENPIVSKPTIYNMSLTNLEVPMAVSGLIAVADIFINSNELLPAAGVLASKPIILGLVGGASMYIADNYLKEIIENATASKGGQLMALEDMFVTPFIVGGGVALASRSYFGIQGSEIMGDLVIGVGAAIAGNYLSTKFF